MRFIGPLIVVNDMDISRGFYEKVLGQKIRYDFGANIEFEGGFSIHLKSHFSGLINLPESEILVKANNTELYFEEDDLEGVAGKLDQWGINYVHRITEQPWGQRVLRFYDPDCHIVEVGESIESTARRFLNKGLTAEETAKRISMPLEFVKGLMSNDQ